MQGTPRTFRLDTLILKHMDYGEADRILVVFSKEKGKVRAIAKGVRKMHSRKAGHLEPFSHTQLFLANGRDMPIVTQAQTIDAFSGLRNDLVKIGYASYIIELVDRFSSEDGENLSLYLLLLETLERLEVSQDLFCIIQYFELHFLDIQGFKPELIKCVKCKKSIKPEDQYFSAELGGVLCPACGLNVSQSHAVSLAALKFLRHFQRSKYSEVLHVNIEPKVRAEMVSLMGYYITYILERRLNSPDFIKIVEYQRSIK